MEETKETSWETLMEEMMDRTMKRDFLMAIKMVSWKVDAMVPKKVGPKVFSKDDLKVI